MRILVFLALLLTGAGCIVYSYVGSLFVLAGEVGRSVDSGDGFAAFSQIVDFLLRSEMPRLTSFLYVGVFLIAIAIVNLIVRSKADDKRDIH